MHHGVERRCQNSSARAQDVRFTRSQRLAAARSATQFAARHERADPLIVPIRHSGWKYRKANYRREINYLRRDSSISVFAVNLSLTNPGPRWVMDLDSPHPRCPFCADPMRFRRFPPGHDKRTTAQSFECLSCRAVLNVPLLAGSWEISAITQ
jgi:hypothetical protein